jgi:hypothetical protein
MSRTPLATRLGRAASIAAEAAARDISTEQVLAERAAFRTATSTSAASTRPSTSRGI